MGAEDFVKEDEVFVITPKGKVVTLPVGSTAVDFAYAVHTEVGHKCIGAKVNGRLVPLHHLMKSGDTCEIFTSKSEDAGPTRDWLQFVESPRARNKIKQWFSRERRDDMLEAGREVLTRELRRLDLPVSKLLESPALLAEAEPLAAVLPEASLAKLQTGANARSQLTPLSPKSRNNF